ncbi:hypothetical protein K450DRAFT_219302 [Umbelopsis ramanniana AG]|uniref:Uncharacterized protein n=1 Tax=Umbelopsis ramanniana AG TaxID=1314678 RepID=A0AAD5EL14_UMBRA|nr:uncharacterized protein K450DRAFT_219302 [Umbelopsis ramanniana AG]KAI8584320.1 hypothetical protein K450DRAFT_219302 [Umbelopsis ramanniana AG]
MYLTYGNVIWPLILKRHPIWSAVLKKKREGKITKLQYVEDHGQKCRTSAGSCAIVVTLCMITLAPIISTKVLA